VLVKCGKGQFEQISGWTGLHWVQYPRFGNSSYRPRGDKHDIADRRRLRCQEISAKIYCYQAREGSSHPLGRHPLGRHHFQIRKTVFPRRSPTDSHLIFLAAPIVPGVSSAAQAFHPRYLVGVGRCRERFLAW
jgi:hypothetical protein